MQTQRSAAEIAPAISVADDGDSMTGAMHPIRFSLARPETPA